VSLENTVDDPPAWASHIAKPSPLAERPQIFDAERVGIRGSWAKERDL
jgi:hypothetical protein